MVDDHAEMLRRWIWRDFANITMGFWLLTSPATLGYRSVPMTWSDGISGALIVVLGACTLSARFDLARWGICLVGLWLLMAPLIFWTPDPGAYANDTLVGTLVITFSVLVPMMPSRAHHRVMMTPGPETPPGWSYNPSDWIQRGPIIAMAFVGFVLLLIAAVVIALVVGLLAMASKLLAVAVAIPLYLVLMLALYVVMFGFYYHGWREIFDLPAPPPADDGTLTA